MTPEEEEALLDAVARLRGIDPRRARAAREALLRDAENEDTTQDEEETP